MLRINFKKIMTVVVTAFMLSTTLCAVSSILCANEAQARISYKSYEKQRNGTSDLGKTSTSSSSSSGVFGALQAAGGQIFEGMREIIFVVSGFGIIAVAIGGFFGNLNWKWLAAIGIGLFVISTTSAVIEYMVGQAPGNFEDVQARVQDGS